MTKRYLDYNNTCPTIDRGISDMEDNLDTLVYDLVQELSPLFCDTDAGHQFIKDTVKYFTQQIEPIFENVRQSNEDMRKAAEKQINELVDEIDDLKADLSFSMEN